MSRLEPPKINVSWQTRTIPLEPCGAWAMNETAVALAERLAAVPDAELRGVAGDAVLVVLGPATKLPWVDGIAYLGRDEAASSLLLPTYLQPNVHVGLLESALQSEERGALAVLLGAADAEPALVPLVAARPFDPERLTAWAQSLRGTSEENA